MKIILKQHHALPHVYSGALKRRAFAWVRSDSRKLDCYGQKFTHASGRSWCDGWIQWGEEKSKECWVEGRETRRFKYHSEEWLNERRRTCIYAWPKRCQEGFIVESLSTPGFTEAQKLPGPNWADYYSSRGERCLKLQHKKAGNHFSTERQELPSYQNDDGTPQKGLSRV